MRRLAPLFVLVVAFTAVPAGAEDEQVVLVERTVHGAHWIAAKVQLPGDGLFKLAFDGPAAWEGMMASGWLLDEEGDVIEAVPFFGESALTVSAHARTPIANAGASTVRPDFGDGAGSFGFATQPAGTYIALMATAGPFDEMRISIEATAGTVLLGVTEGSSAFIATEKDFEGTVVVARAPGGPRAAFVRDASVTRDVDHALYGAFWGGTLLSAGTVAISWQGPTGAGTGEEIYLFDGALPGEYVFRIDEEIGAGEYGPQTILVGADVVLP